MAESVVDVIARARRAQQLHEQRHDVQLEVPGWDTLTEREKTVLDRDKPSQLVGCGLTDSDWSSRNPGFTAPYAGTQVAPRSVSVNP